MASKKHIKVIDFILAVGTLALVVLMAGYYNSEQEVFLAPGVQEPLFSFGAKYIQLANDASFEKSKNVIIDEDVIVLRFEPGRYYFKAQGEEIVKLAFEEQTDLKIEKLEEGGFGVFPIELVEVEVTYQGEMKGSKSFAGSDVLEDVKVVYIGGLND